MSESTEQLAEAFFGAVQRADLDAVRELYAPDVKVWHNVTGKTQTRDENLKLLRFFTSRVEGRRYEVLSRQHFPGGFVQRHVLHGKTASGETIAAPVCIVIYVAGGRITELFEYLDQEAVRAAFA
jgi:ketosteroid isomerase-like protein